MSLHPILALDSVLNEYADYLRTEFRAKDPSLKQALERELEASLGYLDTCDVCEPDRLLSTCKACNHHDCSHEDVPHLVAGFRANRIQG